MHRDGVCPRCATDKAQRFPPPAPPPPEGSLVTGAVTAAAWFSLYRCCNLLKNTEVAISAMGDITPLLPMWQEVMDLAVYEASTIQPETQPKEVADMSSNLILTGLQRSYNISLLPLGIDAIYGTLVPSPMVRLHMPCSVVHKAYMRLYPLGCRQRRMHERCTSLNMRRPCHV